MLTCAFLPLGALAQGAAPPTLDCDRGFAGLEAEAHALAGAQVLDDRGFEVVKLETPESWRVEMAFTSPWHPAHPAATLRTMRKQVTGVWTAESKGCGFGDQGAFNNLMAEMKAGDTQLTNASRRDAARKQESRSPLDTAP
jgi:hypothetical protein